MKKGWPTKRLGDLFVFKNGRAFKKEEWTTKGLPIIRIQNLNNEDASFNYFAGEYSQDILVEPGDLLFSWSGTVGSSFGSHLWKGEPGVLNQHIFKIGLRETIAKRYAFHGLRYITAEIEQSVSGAVGLVHITKEKLNEFTLPVPPLAEQQRIVGLLDEAFEGLATAKANAEKNLQNARALFESHLQSVFTQRGKGWVEKPLGDLCDFLNGFAFKSGDALAESQTQLVRMGNLYGNQLDLDRSPVFYPDGFATEHSRYVLEEGDIIMSLTGTTGKEDYGFAVRIPDCGLTLLMNQRIMKFDALKRDIIDDGYLLHYLRSRCFLDVLYPTANGTRQANLSSVTIKLLPVPLRSLKEQKAIATKLDDLREETQRLARIYERKLAALAELKKSLLHLAFTGEL